MVVAPFVQKWESKEEDEVFWLMEENRQEIFFSHLVSSSVIFFATLFRMHNFFFWVFICAPASLYEAVSVD